MKHYARTLIIATLTTLGSASAMADHNSIHGAGWANMPNDIHNTRIEDNLSSTAFRDFVSKGAGADTVNRYLDSSSVSGAGQAATAQRGGRR